MFNKISVMNYRWTWIWWTTVWQIFAYDGRYAWSQSDAYQVFVICIWRILHMTDQFSWSHWVRHIQVHLYLSWIIVLLICVVAFSRWRRMKCCSLRRGKGVGHAAEVAEKRRQQNRHRHLPGKARARNEALPTHSAVILNQTEKLNPSNAEATFVQITKMQKYLKTILNLSSCYSLESSHRVLSDEYPFARVSAIFSYFHIILYWSN